MSVDSLLGLLALDALLAAVGSAVVAALGLAATPRAALRLAGLGWLVGAALMGTVVALELMAGVPFGLAAVLLTAAAIGLSALVVALGRRRPAGRPARKAGLLVPTAVGVGVAVLVVEAQFRAGRLAGLYEWDSWAFWVPKGEVVYYFGGIDPSWLAHSTNNWYPPLVPTLNAFAFSFMGGTDVVTLHLLYWSAFAAFVAAVGGLLAPLTRPVFLWPTLIALITTPVVVGGAVSPLADLLLDYLVALAVILVWLWLEGAPHAFVALASAFLAAGAFTKQEGLLLAACVLAAAAAASWRTRRRAWPRLALAAVPVVGLPFLWRAWLAAHDIHAKGPELGYFGAVHHAGRAWPSLHLTLHVLWAGTWWRLVPVLVVAAIVVAWVARIGSTVAYATTFFVLGVLACSWVTFSFPSFEFTTNGAVNPIVRLTGGLVIPAAVVVPLLLTAAWARER
jgi:hypothetical protein